MKNVRIFYKKLGTMKFVSHLDMNRFMSRLLSKSGIPVWYTEGFNQHIYMNFALPLSLGFEGHYEIMDIHLTDENYDLDLCLNALKKVGPPDIEFIGISGGIYPMKTIGFAKYELEFENFLFTDRLDEFLKQESILCEKSGKKGKVKIIDLIPKIKDYKITEKGVNFILVAGNEDNLNPTLIMSVFFEQCNIAPVYYTVKRTMIYNREGKVFE